MFNKYIMYDDLWTRWVDDRFIRALQNESIRVNRSLTKEDDEIMSTVAKELNEMEGMHFSLEEIKKRFNLAENRYKTWNAIINRLDVNYDATKNTVVATEETWEEICSQHDLGEIYAYENEHMWIDLMEIFGTQTYREFGQAVRTPRLISDKIYTEQELTDESVLVQSRFDDVRHLRKLLNDPTNKRFMGQSSRLPPEEVVPMPGNPILRWEDMFTGTPEERFDREKESQKDSLTSEVVRQHIQVWAIS